MLSLNSILSELSEDRINQVAARGIEGAGGDEDRHSHSSSRSSRSGIRPTRVRPGGRRRRRPIRVRRRPRIHGAG